MASTQKTPAAAPKEDDVLVVIEEKGVGERLYKVGSTVVRGGDFKPSIKESAFFGKRLQYSRRHCW